jgi:hypothetical protein
VIFSDKTDIIPKPIDIRIFYADKFQYSITKLYYQKKDFIQKNKSQNDSDHQNKELKIPDYAFGPESRLAAYRRVPMFQ